MRKFWHLDLGRHGSLMKREEVHKTHRRRSAVNKPTDKKQCVHTKHSERKNYVLIYPQKTDKGWVRMRAFRFADFSLNLAYLISKYYLHSTNI